MCQVRMPNDLQTSILALILAVLLPPIFTFAPHPVTPSPAILRRILRAPLPGRLSTPIAITFHKPRSVTPQLSPHEMAIDSTFGFVASEEASEAACQRISGLSNHQRNLCRRNPGLIWALIDGTQLGLYECVHQFKHERWNCSMARVILGRPQSEALPLSKDPSPTTNLIGELQKTLEKGTRETAFVTAAWAAGAVQAVTRACSRGRISTCDCDISRHGGLKAADSEGAFTWGGCSDPIRFGMRLVRLLQEPRITSAMGADNRRRLRLHALGGKKSDTREEKKSDDDIMARCLIDVHNQKVGRRFIWQSREKKCKCHGISGACTLRTCWQRVGTFRGVGDLLKKAYSNALQVSFDAATRQLRRLADPLYFGGMPLPAGHLMKRSTSWFVGSNGGNLLAWQRRRRETQFGEKWIKRQKDKLVYLDYSPDYCKADHRIGHFGVAGRQCDVDIPNSPNSCSKICCGRGYDTFEVDTKEKCGCKFVWCCEVKCKMCHRKDRINRCKPESTALSRRIDELLNVSSISLWRGQRRKSKF
ncbi:protein Wnt 2 [Echinococcus multilocularis]|uniref:Protein Wnt n=1 Tax=Echinococcus multilocularis TaxID=6211 RepID=A0A068Y570_ECHMU|nr:protein Wnt 2 [Echinococcus multilocularis]